MRPCYLASHTLSLLRNYDPSFPALSLVECCRWAKQAAMSYSGAPDPNQDPFTVLVRRFIAEAWHHIALQPNPHHALYEHALHAHWRPE